MAIWHLKSKRRPSGGLLSRHRKKKRSDRGIKFLQTKVGAKRAKNKRTRGGSIKKKLLSADAINVADPKTGKISKTKVVGAEKNPANPHYVRRNILTKGTIVKTELGLVKVTSRPCQHGVINGVLVEN